MIRFLVRSLFFFWLAVMSIAMISNWIEGLLTGTGFCEESIAVDSAQNIVHSRSWTATDFTDHCVSYPILRQDYERSHDARSHLSDPQGAASFNEYWGSIYRQLIKNEKNYLGELYDSLDHIRMEKSLDRNAFAHAVLSFVQDIPYTLIIDDCLNQESSQPCYNGGDWGILSPTEFMYSLKGDCDTRTVLLYVLLEQFGYDPLVMVSREYAHSMLALDIQATGYSVLHGNTKHYFWETTNTGWQPGMIAPDMQNLDYWHIALYNEL